MINQLTTATAKMPLFGVNTTLIHNSMGTNVTISLPHCLYGSKTRKYKPF